MIGWVAFFFLPKEVYMFTMAEVKVSHLFDNLCPCMNALLQSSFRIKGEISHLPPVTALFIPLILCHHLLPTRFNIIYIIFWGLKIDGFYKSNQLNFRSVSESHTQALGTMIFLLKYYINYGSCTLVQSPLYFLLPLLHVIWGFLFVCFFNHCCT